MRKLILILAGVILVSVFLVSYNQDSVEVSNMRPSGGEQIEDSMTSLKFNIDSSEDFRYTLILDNKSIKNLQLLEGQGSNLSVETGPLAPGTHKWKVNVSTDKRDYSSKVREFHTTEKPDFKSPRFISINEVSISGENVEVEVINARKTNYTAYVNGRRMGSGYIKDLGMRPYNQISIDVSEISHPSNIYLKADPGHTQETYETLVWPLN